MLTQKEIKEVLDYDPDTGVFTWKYRADMRPQWNARYAKKVAGTLSKFDGYIEIAISYQRYKAHRLAWLFTYGKFPDKDIDHINGKRTDNRIINLRDVSRQENLRNAKKKSNNTSGVTGVDWYEKYKKWRVRIGVGGVSKTLGYFRCISVAKETRRKAEIKYGYSDRHGE